jgi:hypothetical protein
MIAMMMSMMARQNICKEENIRLHNALLADPRVSNLNIKVPTTHPGYWAFRVDIIKTEPVIIEKQKIVKISISIPSDAIGNRGPEAPYYEPNIPQTIETALIDENNNILNDEIQRFSSIEELLDYLKELVGNKV